METRGATGNREQGRTTRQHISEHEASWITSKWKCSSPLVVFIVVITQAHTWQHTKLSERKTLTDTCIMAFSVAKAVWFSEGREGVCVYICCCDASVMLCVMCCVLFVCIVLYCIVLYCIVLYCIVLYCIVLYCIVLYCIVLCCIVLYCVVLCYPV